MIQISGTFHSRSAFVKDGGSSVAYGHEEFYLHPVAIRLNSDDDSTVYFDEADVSSMSQSTKVWGKLRDRACLHTKADGDIIIDGTFGDYWTTNEEMCYRSTTTVSGHVVRDLFEWESKRRSRYTVPSTTQTVLLSGTEWVTRFSAYTVDLHWVGDGDYGALIRVVSLREQVTLKPIKQEGSAPRSCAYRLYRRIPNSTGYDCKVSAWTDASWSQVENDFILTIGGITVSLGDLSESVGAFAELDGLRFWQSVYYETPALSIDEVRALCASWYASLTRGHARETVNQALAPMPFQAETWGALAHDILEQHKAWDADILATIIQFAELRDLVPTITGAAGKLHKAVGEFIAGVRNPRGALRRIKRLYKANADAYLTYQYGIAPLLRDWQAVCEGLVELMTSSKTTRLHSRRIVRDSNTLGMAREALHVLITEAASLPRHFLGVAYRLQRILHFLGISAKTSTLYDVLPWSFVAGWFVNLGDFTTWMDDVIYSRYYPVAYVVQSVRVVTSSSPYQIWSAGPPAFGGLEIVRYERWINTDLPLSDVPKIETPDGLTNHLWEAGSLVSQGLR